MLRSLISASVRFRFLVIAVTAGIMALAVATVPGIHADVLPETAPVVARIQTEAPGLSAPEVESLVTVPLEKNLLEGVMGVTDVTSDSIPGLSQINLDFASGTNLDQARQLVQERLTQAFVLPNVSKPPVLLQPVSSTGNVMLVGLSSRQLSLIDLSVLARWTIVPRLLGVPGVADVSTFGEADRQLQVLVDPARLAARHITLAQIIETAGNAQLVSPLSYLEGSTPGTGGILEGPNQRVTIQPVLPFGTPANLGQVPVAETTGPRPVPLGSVTDIVVGHQPLIGDALVRGQPGLVLVVQKLPSASVPAVTDGLNQALAQLRPSLSGVQVDTSLFRPASYIGSAWHNLSRGADRRGHPGRAGADRAAAEPAAGRDRADRHGNVAAGRHRGPVPARIHVQRAGHARPAAGPRGRGRRERGYGAPPDDPPAVRTSGRQPANRRRAGPRGLRRAARPAVRRDAGGAGRGRPSGLRPPG